MKLAKIAEILSLTPLAEDLAEQVPCGYSIDSRSLSPGDLFFAIKGEKFDGHDFVADALTNGACAAIVSRPLPLSSALMCRVVMVQDTLLSLQTVAHHVITQWAQPVIGITGSAGKTTTKELTALVMAAAGRVLKSVGNLNNTFGLPLSVLQMESRGAQPADFDFAVLEMGMSTPGEIRRLCEIAPPDVGVVINVGAAHLEFFGSLEAIAQAKAELVEGLKPQGLAILNADDHLVRAMADRHPNQIKFFGLSKTVDIRAVDIKENGVLGIDFCLITPQGEATAHLPLMGKHLLYNALAAAAVGDHFGLSAAQIAAQLRLAKPAPHRGEVIHFPQGFIVVDDSYNSNPPALDEMVRMLVAVNGVERRIVVAGEMLELGHTAEELHRSSGNHIAQHKIDLLIGARGMAKEIVNGALAAGMAEKNTFFAPSCELAAQWLIDNIRKGDLVLIKGSRGVRTELILDALKEKFVREEE